MVNSKQTHLTLKIKSDHLMDFLFLIDHMYMEKEKNPTYSAFFEHMDLPIFPDIPEDYDERAEEIAGNIITGWSGNRGRPSQKIEDYKALINQLTLDLLVTEKYLPNQQELTAIEKIIILHEYGTDPLSDGKVESITKANFYKAYRNFRYDEAEGNKKSITRSRRRLIKAIADHYIELLAPICSSNQQIRVCLGYISYELGIVVPPNNIDAILHNQDFKDYCRDQFRYSKL